MTIINYFFEITFFLISLLASKIAVGTILLGISSEYVNNNRKESIGSTLSVKEQVRNATTTQTIHQLLKQRQW